MTRPDGTSPVGSYVHSARPGIELALLDAERLGGAVPRPTAGRAPDRRLRAAGYDCGLLAVQAAYLECQKDVGEAPEQREEPDPDQQQ